MLTGPPQKLTSKFKISFNLALSMLEAKQDILAFMDQSMLSSDIRREIRGYEVKEMQEQTLVQKKEEQIQLCRTPKTILEHYAELNSGVSFLTNAARKKVRVEMNSLETEHKFLLADLPKLLALHEAQMNYATVKQEKKNTIEYIANTVNYLTKILVRDGFSSQNASEAVNTYTITDKGRVAAQLQEVHPLAMADLYFGTNKFVSLDAAQLAGLFSCFYPLTVSDELKSHHCTHTSMHEITLHMAERLDHYLKAEQEAYLLTGANYEITYDLLPYVIQWCDAVDEVACKHILQTVKAQTGVFIGEFVKALLKVNAIALEFERVCEITQNIALLEKLREIPRLTLKYIATSQSLYL